MMKLLTPEQAAETLGIGKTKLYELLNGGAFPVVKIGRASRIPADSIDTWIREQIAEASGGSAR